MTDKFGQILIAQYVVRRFCGIAGLFLHRCRHNIITGVRVDGAEILIGDGEKNESRLLPLP